MKTVLLILVVLFLAAQLIRPDRNLSTRIQTGDLFMTQPAPEAVRTSIEQSCYDCHSNQTRYPWYASIQPLGWWLDRHVNKGKAEVNFSEFSKYSATRGARKLEEAYEEMEDDSMPLKSYTWLHPQARLSAADKQRVLDWLEAAQARLDPDKDEAK